MASSKYKRQWQSRLRPVITRPTLPPSPHRRRLDVPTGRSKCPVEIVAEMTDELED